MKKFHCNTACCAEYSLCMLQHCMQILEQWIHMRQHRYQRKSVSWLELLANRAPNSSAPSPNLLYCRHFKVLCQTLCVYKTTTNSTIKQILCPQSICCPAGVHFTDGATSKCLCGVPESAAMRRYFAGTVVPLCGIAAHDNS